MPYVVCPQCGTRGHLNVPNPDQWYAERHPELAPGDEAPELCFECFEKSEDGLPDSDVDGKKA